MLTTTYLGLTLRSPLVPSAAAPLTEEIDNVRRMEDAGAGAVVLHSLFEEQLTLESLALHHHLTSGTDSFAEALTYFPEPDIFHVGPAEYLEHIRRAKEAVDIPIIASLNGATLGGWTRYAQDMEQAGADALELNIYSIPTDFEMSSMLVEQNYLEILQAVREVVTIPVAVKLSPYFTNLAYTAGQLDTAGAQGLVLFNRFYQPDINLEALTVEPHVLLSTPQDLRLPLRWIAILYGHLRADLAATGGVQRATDVVKLLMVGARVTMMCSALLRHGIDYLRDVEHDLRQWLTEHEYSSIAELQGTLSQRTCPDPSAFERVQYMRAIQNYRPELPRPTTVVSGGEP